MDIKTILQAHKPKLYEKGIAVMWTNKYISTQLLEIHLNSDVDLASRKEDTIDSTVGWIFDNVPGDKLNILDLGCGPGLYTEKYAQRGHAVNGIDFSENSISYAINSAKERSLNISYRCQDYLSLYDVNRYDLITMIFTDFCVLEPRDRDILLQNVFRALKPGGTFLFDVMNDDYAGISESRSWEAADKGFWSPCPYLALSENIYYKDEKVILSQHIVIDEKGETEIYRFWSHLYSNNDLAQILSIHNFLNPNFFENVIPDSVNYRSGDVTFCITTKQV
jgi:2-polyprenyl-3-methyl-5-hydroxy-6-metoxy-1,4-benzoquinol methylase